MATPYIGIAPADLSPLCRVPSCPFLEFPFDPPNWTPGQRDFLLAQPIAIDAQGYVHLPEPGLGVELDEEKLQQYEVSQKTVGGGHRGDSFRRSPEATRLRREANR